MRIRAIIAGAAGTFSLAALAVPGAASAGAAMVPAAAIHAVRIKPPANFGGSALTANMGAVACIRTGDCVAGGTYSDTTGTFQAMVVTESNRSWKQAHELVLPSNDKAGTSAGVNSVSCTGIGSCVAVGDYNGFTQGFVATESGGKWSHAFLIKLPVNAAHPTNFQLDGVACTKRGSCVAVGGYNTAAGFEALAVAETGGKWQRARAVRMPANEATTSRYSFLLAVACDRTGPCTAVGQYNDKSGVSQAVTTAQSGAKWRTGSEITLPRGVSTTNASAYLGSVACAGVGFCVAVGSYRDHTGVFPAMAVAESAGKWARARSVKLVPSNAGPVPNLYLNSVTCISKGTCLANGGYRTKAAGFASVALFSSGGKWTRANEILPPPDAATGVKLESGTHIGSCTSTGYCVIVGIYNQSAGGRAAMAAVTHLR